VPPFPRQGCDGTLGGPSGRRRAPPAFPSEGASERKTPQNRAEAKNCWRGLHSAITSQGRSPRRWERRERAQREAGREGWQASTHRLQPRSAGKVLLVVLLALHPLQSSFHRHRVQRRLRYLPPMPAAGARRARPAASVPLTANGVGSVLQDGMPPLPSTKSQGIPGAAARYCTLTSCSHKTLHITNKICYSRVSGRGAPQAA
jgi:hypothetical protein